MHNDEFRKGFRYELANRSFVLMAVERMSRRLQGDERGIFWEAYLTLERFNVPRYRAASKAWGIKRGSFMGAKVKAVVVGSTPKCLIRHLLKFVYVETNKYLRDLRMLHRLGPLDSKAFLDYMIDQKELQIEMMRMAIAGNYQQIPALVDTFMVNTGSRELIFSPH